MTGLLIIFGAAVMYVLIAGLTTSVENVPDDNSEAFRDVLNATYNNREAEKVRDVTAPAHIREVRALAMQERNRARREALLVAIAWTELNDDEARQRDRVAHIRQVLMS